MNNNINNDDSHLKGGGFKPNLNGNKKTHSTDLYYKVGVLGYNSKNPLIRFVSLIFYATNHEQDAMVNGMYQSLIEVDNNILFEKSKDTQAGILLQTLRIAYKRLSDKSIKSDPRYNNMIQWLSQFDIEFDLNQILKLCDFRIKRLESKIGKVITKVKKDRGMIFSENSFHLDQKKLLKFY